MVKLSIPPEVNEILRVFEKHGYEIYIVGGAVRDILMGKMVYDWDFTTSATPTEMLKFLPDAYYDNKFGTVGIPGKAGERPFEITTFRTEQGYSDSRRPDNVEWGKSLEEDLKRRDFTINSMALKRKGSVKGTGKTSETELIDSFGGQKDLEKKRIRAVGEASERFSEDALRMMRAVRISAELGFTVEDTTFEAIKMNAKKILNISRERIRDELLKIIKSPNPYEGMIIFKNSGLMDEILPELSKTFGVEQKSPGRHHVYDVGTHSMLSLKFVSERNNDPIVRFATLIHDIGKPPAFKKIENGTITFYNHEIIGGKIAKRISDRLKFSRKDSEKLYRLVRYHQFTVDEKQTDSAVRRFIRKVGTENINDMLDLRIGDRLGGGATETSWRLEEFKKRLIEVQKQPFSITDLKISGTDVMKTLNIPSGPKVGKVLKDLFDKVVKNQIPNNKDALIKEISENQSSD